MSSSSFTAAAGGGGSGDALVADPLSQFAPTTSAQLAATISDEVGTGPLVFESAVTDAIAAANATNAMLAKLYLR